MKVTDLSKRDIINLSDGRRLGAVKDMHINPEDGTIMAIVLEGRKKKFGVFRGGRDIVVPWDRIHKIGTDALLVDIKPEELAE